MHLRTDVRNIYSNMRGFQGSKDMKNTEDYRRRNEREEEIRHASAGRAGEVSVYRELTRDGRRFCAAAALLEELVVLAVFGIRISTSPAPVLAFLWVLFAILTAAALIGAGWLAEYFRRFGTAVQRIGADRSAAAVRAGDSAPTAGRRVSVPQRIAA